MRTAISFRTDMREGIGRLEAEIAGPPGEIRQEIAALLTEVGDQIDSVRTDIGDQIGSIQTQMHDDIAKILEELHGLRADLQMEIGGLPEPGALLGARRDHRAHRHHRRRLPQCCDSHGRPGLRRRHSASAPTVGEITPPSPMQASTSARCGRSGALRT